MLASTSITKHEQNSTEIYCPIHCTAYKLG